MIRSLSRSFVVTIVTLVAAPAAAQTPPVPAVHISPAEIAALLETAIVKSAVDHQER